jgi:hypothetical protein
MSKATYIGGREAFFNQGMLEELKDWVSFGCFYVSNWRVLHIDGFEGGYPPLPASKNHMVHFEFRTSSTTTLGADHD